MSTIQEQIKSGVGTVVCLSCEHGDHSDRAEHPGCPCPCHGVPVCLDCQKDKHGLPRQTGLADVPQALLCTCACHWLEDEQASDARQDLSDWLGSARRDISEMADDLLRAHSSATRCEPVTALVILPLIEQVRRIEARLNELVGVR